MNVQLQSIRPSVKRERKRVKQQVDPGRGRRRERVRQRLNPKTETYNYLSIYPSPVLHCLLNCYNYFITLEPPTTSLSVQRYPRVCLHDAEFEHGVVRIRVWNWKAVYTWCFELAAMNGFHATTGGKVSLTFITSDLHCIFWAEIVNNLYASMPDLVSESIQCSSLALWNASAYTPQISHGH